MVNHADVNFNEQSNEVRISIWCNPSDELYGEYMNFMACLTIREAKNLAIKLENAITELEKNL